MAILLTIPDIVIGEMKRRVIKAEEINWRYPKSTPPGWTRLSADLAPGVIAQAYARKGQVLVDVFNQLHTGGIFLGFDQKADPGEYDRIVPLHAGIGWSSSPPGFEMPQGSWLKKYPTTLFSDIDTWYTPTTGSPRDFLHSPHVWRYQHGGLTQEMAVYFDKFARGQLLRRYQQPGKGAIPEILLGQPLTVGAKDSNAMYSFLGGTVVTPMDVEHQHVGTLRDGYILANNPRCLDQLVRELLWSISTQWYYQVKLSDYPYGGSERVPGWHLLALCHGMECARMAQWDWLEQLLRKEFDAHLQWLEEIGMNELGLPNVYHAYGDGRHLLAPHNIPWMGATVLFALDYAIRNLELPVSSTQKWLDYVDNFGWDGVGVAHDAVPHFPSDQGVLPNPAGVPGVGCWAAAPLSLLKPDSPYLAWIIEKCKAAKIGGSIVYSPDGALDWFAPLFP